MKISKDLKSMIAKLEISHLTINVQDESSFFDFAFYTNFYTNSANMHVQNWI